MHASDDDKAALLTSYTDVAAATATTPRAWTPTAVDLPDEDRCQDAG